MNLTSLLYDLVIIMTQQKTAMMQHHNFFILSIWLFASARSSLKRVRRQWDNRLLKRTEGCEELYFCAFRGGEWIQEGTLMLGYAVQYNITNYWMGCDTMTLLHIQTFAHSGYNIRVRSTKRGIQTQTLLAAVVLCVVCRTFDSSSELRPDIVLLFVKRILVKRKHFTERRNRNSILILTSSYYSVYLGWTQTAGVKFCWGKRKLRIILINSSFTRYRQMWNLMF